MASRGSTWHFCQFLPAVRQAARKARSSASEVLYAFFSRFSLSELHAIKPLKYPILPLLIILLTSQLLVLNSPQAADPPKRIISLAPNMTELLFEIGFGDRVVGVTSFCDYPEDARNRQKVGGMSNPSLEAVVSLRPDVVVMTTDGNPKEFAEKLRSLNIKTYVFKARRISELPQGIRDLGTALGEKEKAEAIAKPIEREIDRFVNTSRATRHALRKKVLFIVWPEPLIVAGQGTVINDAIQILGGENIAVRAKTVYPKYSVEEILRESPDMIFIGNMNEEIRNVSAPLLRKLKTVSAVKNKKVFFVSDLLYRLGPRTVKGMEELAQYMDN